MFVIEIHGFDTNAFIHTIFTPVVEPNELKLTAIVEIISILGIDDMVTKLTESGIVVIWHMGESCCYLIFRKFGCRDIVKWEEF